MPRLPRLPAVAAALVAFALAGCGTVGDDRPEVEATLLLDGPPSAADAGIATAVERGFDGAEGVHLRVRRARAGGTSGAANALKIRRVQFAVMPAGALEDEPALVGVMALTTRGGATRQLPDRVLVTTRAQLDEQPSVVRATVRALLRGYDMLLTDPASSLSDLQALFPDLARPALETQLDRVEGSIFPPGRQMGTLPDLPRYEPGIVPAAAATNHDS